MLYTFLAGDAADESGDGALLVDAQLVQHRRLSRFPDLGVNAVEDHVDLVGVNARVRIQDRVLHTGRYGNDGIGVFHGVFL